MVVNVSNIEDYSSFQEAFTNVLHKHAPIKERILRYNNNPSMTKRLRKAIMLRSKMKNIYNEKHTQESLNSYKKQQNFCANLLQLFNKQKMTTLAI